MISQKLQKAREYELEKQVEKDQKPLFHITSQVGWINDPNGFSVFENEYHMFFQYHPYSTIWGPMHWGHVKSKDLIHWETMPCALAPDEAYDEAGCFSGSALEWNGKHILAYTAVSRIKNEEGEMEDRQQQAIAIGDGTNYVKLEKNPVITADMLPEGSSKIDFRDPKIFEEDGKIYMVVGSRHQDGSGQMALFSTEDVENWKFENIICQCNNEYGKMWECPDFFELDQKHVLITSPQSMEATGLEMHGGNNVIYFVGEYDKEKKEFRRGKATCVDFGLDFYAPQTTLTKDGRRVMIGWLQNWDNYLTPDRQIWSGMMTIPRELSIKNGKLIQTPIKELDDIWKDHIVFEKTDLNQEKIGNENIAGRVFDMTVKVSGEFNQFKIQVAENEKYHTDLIFYQKDNIFTVDRLVSGMTKDLLTNRSMKINPAKEHTFRIIMDKYSLEIFADDGEKVMSSVVYTTLNADKISFSSDGNASMKVDFKK